MSSPCSWRRNIDLRRPGAANAVPGSRCLRQWSAASIPCVVLGGAIASAAPRVAGSTCFAVSSYRTTLICDQC